ncbi:MAG: hypothetical protein GVY09_14995 [Gammaproteobacteria bacterium]|jgi:hypothetical protein|nr:hypothetical protein [Gammaproteobacteria bacterium]
MAFFDNLRQRLRDAVAPLTDRAAATGLAADRLQLTVLGGAALVGVLLLALPAVLTGLHAVLLLLPAALAARAAAMAVAADLEKRHGAAPGDPALREVTSAATDVLLYLPLAAYPGVPAMPVVVLVVLGLLVEIAGLAPLARGGAKREDGPLNAGDRAIVFAIVGLILALDPGAARWLPWLLLPVAVLAAATLVRRLGPLPRLNA